MAEISDVYLAAGPLENTCPQLVDDKLLNDLLIKGCRASTTGNMQVYSIIITKDEKKKKELAPLHFNQSNDHRCPCRIDLLCRFQTGS